MIEKLILIFASVWIGFMLCAVFTQKDCENYQLTQLGSHFYYCQRVKP